MQCKNCGTQCADDLKFCPYCSAMLETQPQYEDPDLQNFNADAQPSYQAPTTLPTPLWKKVVAILVCLALVIGLAGLCTNWFGFYGPGAKIAKAAVKTFKSKSMTIEITATSGSEEVTGFIQAEIDMKGEEVTFYLEMDMPEGPSIIALYDNYLIIQDPSGICRAQDISEEMETFWERYADVKDKGKDYLKGGQIDWESILTDEDIGGSEDLYEEVSDHINFKQLNKSLSKLSRKFNNTAWLKKNAGYSTKREDGMKLHIFDVDAVKLLEAVVPLFEKAFEDSDDYEMLEDSIDDISDELDAVDICVTFGIKSGKLAMVECAVEAEGQETLINLTFSDLNKTEIDTGALDDLLEEAQLVDNVFVLTDTYEYGEDF